ncbi:MAG: hypothetical protein IJ644_09645 [Oscillospiraceae bacterium]|nr:hypothetical protein [Oscillospiraceae bacterium]
MMLNQKQESEIRFRRPKNKIFLIVLSVIFLFILGSTLFYDRVYEIFTGSHQEVQSEKIPTKSGFALKYNGYDLTAAARQNLAKEFESYNIKYTDYNFYAQRGALLDSAGNVMYSVDTLPVKYQTFYEEGRNRVCKYLYGDLQTAQGIAPLMRVIPNINPDSLADSLPDFPTGYDIQLTINSALEEQIYDLLTLNYIKGGCIVQDLPTGKIEAMTATSITSAESEKSGLTQLEACLNTDFLYDIIQTLENPEEQDLTRKFFDYQVKSAESEITDTESGEIRKIKKYCFTTDFDLILERPDNMKDTDVSEVSPLHLNSITQRLFSGEARVPVLIENILDENGNPVNLLPETDVPAFPELTSEKNLKACYEAYHSENDKNYQVFVMKYTGEKYTDFKYITGVMTSGDGKIQKAFTLYSKDEKILHFIDSMIYFIDNAYSAEGGNPIETEGE